MVINTNSNREIAKKTYKREKILGFNKMIEHQKINFGYRLNGYSDELISFNIDKLANPHFLVCGKSRSGKTVLLKKMIQYAGQKRVLKDGSIAKKTVFTLDFSGDMEVEGENLIQIKGRNSDYAMNLFEIYSHDSDSGGVTKQIFSIVRMIDRYFMDSKMGVVQKNIFVNVLKDTYAQVGITDEDESSWTKKLPTIELMQELIENIIDSVESSINISLMKKISRDGKKIRKLEESITLKNQKIKKQESRENPNQDIVDALRDDISFMDDTATELYLGLENEMHSFLKFKINNGVSAKYETDEEETNIDISKYSESNALNSLKSIKAHIDSIASSGAFSGNLPPLRAGINRFDLSQLSDSLQKLFTDLLCQKTYEVCKSRGNYIDYSNRIDNWKIDTVLAIDEAKTIIPDAKKDKDSKEEIVNVIVNKGLKHGLSLMMASQKVSHFSEDQLTNIHTKVTFELGKNDIPDLKSKLGISEKESNILQNFGIGLVMHGTKKPIPTIFPTRIWA